jgi:thiol-disulfide isomerase/thioredoxin
MKALIFILFCLPGLAANVLAKTPGEVEVGGVLREASLYGFFGDFRKLSELRGKPLIINVWASWCGPCRAEMGSLERLAKRLGARKVKVIGISTDDDAAAAAAFLTKSRVTFDNYLDRNLLLENMLGANTIPLTVLVDAQGRVVKKINGYHDWDSPESADMISKALRLKF